MINKLDIHGFRRFSEYRMNGLRRVNLLVGDNNCGKTTLLEALHILATQGDPIELSATAVRRGEFLLNPSPDSHRGPYLVPELSNLFTGHSVHVGAVFRLEASDQQHVQVSVERVDDDRQPERFDFGVADEGVGEKLQLRTDYKDVGVTGSHQLRIGANGVVSERSLSRRAFRLEQKRNPCVEFLAVESPDQLAVRRMWDQINRDGNEHVVERALQIVRPDLRDVYFESATFAAVSITQLSSAGRAGISVRLGDSQKRIPLASMGDGMFRLLILALGMATTSEGVLLADEIDTGLHWSHMEDLWRLVIGTAIRNNVQVFATTHSADCLKGLAAACEADGELAAVVSVQSIDPMLAESISIAGERLSVVMGQEIEVR